MYGGLVATLLSYCCLLGPLGVFGSALDIVCVGQRIPLHLLGDESGWKGVSPEHRERGLECHCTAFKFSLPSCPPCGSQLQQGEEDQALCSLTCCSSCSKELLLTAAGFSLPFPAKGAAVGETFCTSALLLGECKAICRGLGRETLLPFLPLVLRGRVYLQESNWCLEWFLKDIGKKSIIS